MSYLDGRLKCSLKEEALCLSPVTEGISYLGFRVFPHMIRLQGRTWRSFVRNVKKRIADEKTGIVDERSLINSIASLTGHVIHGATVKARQCLFLTSLQSG